MPRISIVQSDAGDPFVMYRGLINYISSLQSYDEYYEFNGVVQYDTGPAYVRAQGLLYSSAAGSFWFGEHMAFVLGAGGAVIGFRGADGIAAYDHPAPTPYLNITGFSMTEQTALSNFEARARLYAFDYSGSEGNDSLVGTDYEDVLNGNGGNDYLAGGLSNDVIRGGQGNDELRGATGADAIYGGQGDDAISGGQGWDTLLGGAGNDTITGSLGQDHIDGGDGIDTGAYNTATAGVTVDLNNTVLNTGEALGDTIINVENIIGSPYDDDLRGTAGSNNLQGQFGNDTIYGRGGDDFIDGGPGADYLYGGVGADTFHFWLFSQTDYVQDFSFSGGDVLNITLGAAADSFAEVMSYAHQNGNDTVFAFSNNLFLVVANAQVAQFTPGDFLFL